MNQLVSRGKGSQSLHESQAAAVWQRILATLRQRGLLRKAKGGKGFVVPHAQAYVLPDRILFVLDMQRLGGISIEKWEDPDLHHQMSAALGGRRVVITSSGGLAIQVGLTPEDGAGKARRLPHTVPLTPDQVADGDYTVTLGLERSGQAVELDLAGAHRAIITGGTSGSGKSNLLKSIILQLATKHSPDQFQVAIVDAKEVDFPAFEGLPHLFASIAYDLSEADLLIRAIEQERLRRKALMRQHGVSDWHDMPEGERFSLLLLVVDEAADLAGRPAMDLLVNIARKGRAMGISLVLGTQHPTAKVVDSQVKANLPTAIAFQTATLAQSNTILDRAGAEKLNRQGLALTFLEGKWRVVQTLKVDNETISAVVGEPVDRAPLLSETEAALVRYAVEELEGRFIIGKLYQAMKDGPIEEYMPKPRLSSLAREWEATGWLTSPQHATDARKVTPELLSALSASASAPISPREPLSQPVSPVSVSISSPQGAGQGEVPPFLADRASAIEL